MLRKSLFVPVLGLLLLPAVASAQFQQGNWSLELNGQGSNDQDFRTGSAAVGLELGYFATKEILVGVRQSVIWADGGSDLSGSTRLVADYHFDLDRWQPFVGASIGYQYNNVGDDDAGGDDDDDSWVAGPEVGVKYFVNSTTYVRLSAAYDFDLEEGLDEGAFVYGLGIGFKW